MESKDTVTLSKISLESVPVGLLDDISAMVCAQSMAWCWTGVMPLPEPVLTYFTNAYMRSRDPMN